MAEAPGAVLTGHAGTADSEQTRREKMFCDDIQRNFQKISRALDRLGVRKDGTPGLDSTARPLDLKQFSPPSKVKTEGSLNHSSFKILESGYEPNTHDRVMFRRWDDRVEIRWSLSDRNSENSREEIMWVVGGQPPSYSLSEYAGNSRDGKEVNFLRFEGQYGNGNKDLHYSRRGEEPPEEYRFRAALEVTAGNLERIARDRTPLLLRPFVR